MWKRAIETIICDQTSHTIHVKDLYYHDLLTKENFSINSPRAREEDPNNNIRTPGSYVDNFMITNPIDKAYC